MDLWQHLHGQKSVYPGVSSGDIVTVTVTWCWCGSTVDSLSSKGRVGQRCNKHVRDIGS